MKGMSKSELIAFINHAYPSDDSLVLDDTVYEIFLTYGDDYFLDPSYQFQCTCVNTNKVAALRRI